MRTQPAGHALPNEDMGIAWRIPFRRSSSRVHAGTMADIGLPQVVHYTKSAVDDLLVAGVLETDLRAKIAPDGMWRLADHLEIERTSALFEHDGGKSTFWWPSSPSGIARLMARLA